MGWGRFFFLGDLGQQLDLSDQANEIQKLRDELWASRTSSRDAAGSVEQLQAEVDELRLYLVAVVRLLVSKGIVSREELKRVVNAIDAEDGLSDGRRKGRVE
jgi:multidrug resistance efflux pump